MTILVVIFALATFVLLSWVIMKMEELDDYQENLDKYSVHLDELANKLAQWEQQLKHFDNDTHTASEKND